MKEHLFKLSLVVCLLSCKQNTSKDTAIAVQVDVINGKYINNYSEANEEFSGSVSLEYIGSNQLKFGISTYNNSNGCTGQLDGVATLENSYYAKFSNLDCQSLDFELNITKDDITLIINESECEIFHGLTCPFEGRYHKIQSN